MRALVFDPDQPHGLRLGDAPDPVAGASEVLVSVEAASLNFGELAMRSERGEAGAVFGWDAAGVVARTAPDGSGPPVGTRVVTFGWTGAWAELRAVDTAELAVVPESLDLGATSALPVAGVTALQALRRLGSVVGRRVLITGASGGVGRFAVQLAARSGAHVIASVGSLARAEGLFDLGAAEVVVGLDGVTEPVFGVLDNVGGPQLADALALVAEGGSVQWIGRAARTPLSLEVALVENLNRCRLEFFMVGTPFGRDLANLVRLLERGELDPQVGWRGSWERAQDGADALLARRVPGKAVLDIR
jgi:NADPH2:quinone reductase